MDEWIKVRLRMKNKQDKKSWMSKHNDDGDGGVEEISWAVEYVISR